MRRHVALCLAFLVCASSGWGSGLLIPTEKTLPPLALLSHKVEVAIEDQVGVTRVEQVFRNHTDRPLEATYIFPVPKGASVRKFSMWVDGKEVPGELVEADKAREIYTSIVRRTLDPGLLEYMGNNLLRLRVFPVPARGDQKIAVSYTSVADADRGVAEYVYPLKTDAKATSTLEKFSLDVTLKSQHPLQNIYSPTHAVTIARPNDREARVAFAKDQAVLDQDFRLYWTTSAKDVGITALPHRPYADRPGWFLMLVSPRAELSKTQQVPRDMVFVLDTSGSMRGKRIEQAREALKYCLSNLNEQDRFAVVTFATTVNRFSDGLAKVDATNLKSARKWVDELEASGGTAIDEALRQALTLRGADATRNFTVVFFTDGRPTIGETDGEKILKNVLKRNTASTRIFTFGVGNDVNATMLDRLAEDTRALTTYVREAENIEEKVSGLYAKISNPVLTNLRLKVSDTIKISEVYPPELPDLFHGSQLVVLGRYDGNGHAAVSLEGSLGATKKEFVYEVDFPGKTSVDKPFVEDLWARRKVGYLLDQIRVNGEKKELVEEVVTLAKRYGITTPYTSYLVVPDGPVPVAGREGGGVPAPRPDVRFHLGPTTGTGPAPGVPPPVLAGPGGKAIPVEEFAKRAQGKKGDASKTRLTLAEKDLESIPTDDKAAKENPMVGSLQRARDQFEAYRQARRELKLGNLGNVQQGKLGVDLSVQANELRNQMRLSNNAQRWLGDRNALDVGGVWIDENYEASMKAVTVKSMSKAYFRILERHPEMRKVFSLGNHLVWVAPNRQALIVDVHSGVETLDDAAIDALFVPAKK